MDSLGSLSSLSLLFCLGFFDFLIFSNIFGYCQTFLFFVRLFLIFGLQLVRRFII